VLNCRRGKSFIRAWERRIVSDNSLNLSDFDFDIPEDLIAQHPLEERDSSRLLVLNRRGDPLLHLRFREIVNLLHDGDVLVLNDTKVLPARLYGRKPTGGEAEITLIGEKEKNVWKALVKRVHEGRVIIGQDITAEVSRDGSGTVATVRFEIGDRNDGDIKDLLPRIGAMPLPVYIKRQSEQGDLRRYQTVYAKKEGAIAAPTAGLHFTDSLIDQIRDIGVEVCMVTLHVGYGTFRPIETERLDDHRMDEEYYEIPESTADSINRAKSGGRRVIAVGTTVTRALEGAAAQGCVNTIPAGAGSTSIFIRPGHKFRVVDCLLTNFHLPRSTPLMLAAAFAGFDRLMRAYHEAIDRRYRFFSYGDAMMIV
jgi:S-adenosylmethionine:tRNA ribosyltransferase-isomerase